MRTDYKKEMLKNARPQKDGKNKEYTRKTNRHINEKKKEKLKNRVFLKNIFFLLRTTVTSRRTFVRRRDSVCPFRSFFSYPLKILR